jgi:hypothetical protein
MTMMPMSSSSPGIASLSLLSRMKACARRHPAFHLEALVNEGYGRVGEPRIVEARRAGQAVEARIRAGPVVLGGERAGDVAGANAQLQHDRRVAGLGQGEALLDAAHDGGQIGPRVEQPHGGLHGIGIGALLDDARALAIVLADDDHGAADHARRGQVRQRVGSHIGADDRLPGDRAAQGIVDGGAEHGRGGGLVGAGLQVHAQLGHDVTGIHQHVEQVRHRRALVAAHIAHARLQQRLGDGEDAFAAELGALAQPQCRHFGLERAFHGGLACVPANRRATSIKEPITSVAVIGHAGQ